MKNKTQFNIASDSEFAKLPKVTQERFKKWFELQQIADNEGKNPICGNCLKPTRKYKKNKYEFKCKCTPKLRLCRG